MTMAGASGQGGGGAGSGAGGKPGAEGGGQGDPGSGGANDSPELVELRKKVAAADKAEAARKKADEDQAKAAKEKADKEALDRGEHLKLLDTEKQKAKDLEAKNASLALRLALLMALADQDLAKGALDDVVLALERQGVKLGEGNKLEGFEDQLKALRETKAFYFSGEAEAAEDKTPSSSIPGGSPARIQHGQTLVELRLAKMNEKRKTDTNPLQRKKGA
jgi:hypothetical protein